MEMYEWNVTLHIMCFTNELEIKSLLQTCDKYKQTFDIFHIWQVP